MTDRTIDIEDRVLKMLQRARDWVARGWCQGVYAKTACSVSPPITDLTLPDITKVCSVGAIAVARTELQEVETIGDECYRRIAKALPADEKGGLTGYNDAYGRTQQDILRLYGRAIEDQQTRVAALERELGIGDE